MSPRAWALTGLLLAAAAGVWWLVGSFPWKGTETTPETEGTVAVSPSRCAECHARQYESWHRTYHRTMTRDAAPENVKGDFGGVVYFYQGLPTRMTREGDEFFMQTVDPDWARLRADAGDHPGRLPPARSVKLRVDRLVGSHWLQECLHRAPNGRYVRLPVLYHIGERRWIHSNGAFLAPDSADFWAQSRGATWNESCLYCHNTGPSKNPDRNSRGQVVGYETTVEELGIACAACHGPGSVHANRKDNPTDDVVHPARLSVARRDEICAHCHGALVPKASMWDAKTHRDPFIPGQELTRYNDFFWSEAEQAVLVGIRRPETKPARPEPADGRFWGDGTPLTTALEYNGMALSACYQGGKGKLSCLSCHTMHGKDPNFLLKPEMATNEACYQCHDEYRGKLTEHTRHGAGSAGSLCYNCHMPHQVYSLMTTHRSHRIQIPDLESSVGTGKPHACNLCHLDRPLGWTRDQLALWPGQKRKASPKLSAEEETVSSAVLTLVRGDARSRVVVAGAFSNPAAQQASGTDWFGPVLSRLLEDERYPAVRYLAHRGLRSVHGDVAGGFDYLATPAERKAQLRLLRERFEAAPERQPRPHLLLPARGPVDEGCLERLRAGRHDPDLSVNE